MKKLILILVISPTFLFCQGWEKTYGGEHMDWGNSVQPTSDGGYIISGTTTSFEWGTEDVYLIKTNDIGDTIWTSAFGSIYFNDQGFSVQQTIDEGYIISGYTESYGNNNPNVYLIKTNSNGDSLWTKVFGDSNIQKGYSVRQTTDEGYIIAGVSYNNGQFDVYLIKTDSNGNTQWTRTFGGENNDEGYSVQQTTDEGYIIAGATGLYTNRDIYLIKTNADGDTLWTKTVGGEGWDEAQFVQQTTDQGYIVVGYTKTFENNFDVYLIKTDSNGDILWTHTYGESGEDRGYSVQQTTDEGYIITGYTNSFGNSFDVYLIKTDLFGDSLWTRTFGGGQTDYGRSVQQTYDGGYILAGTSYSFGYNFSDAYLIKTDENGIITSTTEIPLPKPNRKLVKTVDLSGRKISIPRKNQPYIEIYDDGTTQKKMKLK